MKRRNKKNKVERKLLNPVIMYRTDGEKWLRQELEKIELSELVEITVTYTPDFEKEIYKSKDKNEVIDFIVRRSEYLSSLGCCFRHCL
jgi:hypothetical protein